MLQDLTQRLNLFLRCLSTLAWWGCRRSREDRMGSNNIRGEKFSSLQLHFLVFHKTVCFSVVVHRTRSDASFTKNHWWRVCVNCPGFGHSQVLRDPLPLVRQYTPLCVAIYERSEMNWEMAGVKNMWPYKYQSQTASGISPVSFLLHSAVSASLCWGAWHFVGTLLCTVLQRKLPSSLAALLAQPSSIEPLIELFWFVFVF
jgi:hypothetical protein